MSDCCLPNLGCLSIPIESTNVLGPPGPNGLPGRGITSTFYDPLTGIVTFTYSDLSTSTTGDIRGSIGANGPQGVAGVSRLYSNTVEGSSIVLNNFDQVAQYVMPANTLINDGDALIVNLRTTKLTNAGNLFAGCQRRIRFNALSCTLFGGSAEIGMISPDANGYQYNTRVEIIKTGATTARCNVVSDYDLFTTTINLQYLNYQLNLTGLDFTISNTISADIFQAASGQVRTKTFTIDKIQIL